MKYISKLWILYINLNRTIKGWEKKFRKNENIQHIHILILKFQQKL